MTLLEAIKAASPGGGIDWSGKAPVAGLKGVDKAVTLRGATFAGQARILGCKGLTIEDFTVADAGTMVSASNVLGVEACENVTLRRGKISATSLTGRGLLIARSKNIRTETLDISGTARGAYVDLSSDVMMLDTEVHDISSDGIDISRSHRITVDGLKVRDIDIGATDAHPDVIQIINSPTNPGICSDILIRGVRAKVQSQGINLFDHDRGGADRITIEDCDLLVGYYHALNLENVRGLILRNIRYGALPGTDPKITPWVKTPGCTDVVIENVVGSWDGSEDAPAPLTIEQRLGLVEARLDALERLA